MIVETPPSACAAPARTPVAVVDVTAGPGAGCLPLVSPGPAFAGPGGGRRRTALREDLVRHAAGPHHDDVAVLLPRYRGPQGPAGSGCVADGPGAD
ncbi:hypothetical protein [Streptomyces sp. NPDC047065]|uniref:hypothetical protein n=1 Tax=Streptomyces sp. NPDC047065 TaxID=3154606 RepID=UPI0033D694FE